MACLRNRKVTSVARVRWAGVGAVRGYLGVGGERLFSGGGEV